MCVASRKTLIGLKLQAINYQVSQKKNYRPFFCKVTARVFANPDWKTMESYKCKSLFLNAIFCNNVTKFVDFVKNKINVLWEVFYLDESLQKICYICFNNVVFYRPCKPRRFVYQHKEGLQGLHFWNGCQIIKYTILEVYICTFMDS